MAISFERFSTWNIPARSQILNHKGVSELKAGCNETAVFCCNVKYEKCPPEPGPTETRRAPSLLLGMRV